MCRLVWVLLLTLRSAFRSRQALVSENAALRHQLATLIRSGGRSKLKAADGAFWVLLRRTWSGWRGPLVIVRPETVVRWHRDGFRLFWR
jgi:putative transposase